MSLITTSNGETKLFYFNINWGGKTLFSIRGSSLVKWSGFIISGLISAYVWIMPYGEKFGQLFEDIQDVKQDVKHLKSSDSTTREFIRNELEKERVAFKVDSLLTLKENNEPDKKKSRRLTHNEWESILKEYFGAGSN